MSNKRIDLTQFEGMTKGSWKHRDMSNEKQTEWDLWSYDENGDPQVWLAQLGYYQDGGHSDAQDWERLHATWRAMSATPNLIDELKRCYEEIDLLREYAKCGNCGGRYIGPMDYGVHEHEHSEDCFDASE